MFASKCQALAPLTGYFNLPSQWKLNKRWRYKGPAKVGTRFTPSTQSRPRLVTPLPSQKLSVWHFSHGFVCLRLLSTGFAKQTVQFWSLHFFWQRWKIHDLALSFYLGHVNYSWWIYLIAFFCNILTIHTALCLSYLEFTQQFKQSLQMSMKNSGKKLYVNKDANFCEF